MSLENLIVIALFVETVIQAIKPVWNEDAKKLSWPECLSMAIGVAIAVLAKVNMLDGLFPAESVVLNYVLYVCTGIALGRGPSFAHDVWTRFRAEKTT